MIGEPGADKILVIMKRARLLPLDSNGLRVLSRVGLISEAKDYRTTYRRAQETLAPSLPANRPPRDPGILGHRGWSSDEEALRKIAACLSEDIELHLRLDALRGDQKLQPPRQSDDAVQNGPGLRAIEVRNEAAVDLDHVERKRLQI